MAEAVPVSWGSLPDWLRKMAQAINGILDGRMNNTGSVTLTASQATTVVTDPRVGTTAVICFMATTANAAAEVGAGGMYVSSRGDGTFTITHANNAQTDRDFEYTVIGAG